jgi:hypothetical protein
MIKAIKILLSINILLNIVFIAINPNTVPRLIYIGLIILNVFLYATLTEDNNGQT